VRFLSQFNNILVYVLLGAGFIKLMLDLWVDASIILGVVILNALLGFIQEGKAEKALDSIRNMLSAEARTVRGGETRMIPAEQLVPGDIVLLESGDKVPADLRLVDAKNLRTDEAALTGESVPAEKTIDAVAANATVGDRESMAFSGTMVVSGRATGVVVATGRETELGRINQLLSGVSAIETPLLRQIKQFGYTITVVIAAVSVLRLRQMGDRHGVRRALPGRRQHRGVGHSGRPAGDHHDHVRHRRAAHGPAQRDYPAVARCGDARIGVAHLL
jgi:magnesium-transporting ATPase (P-type)